MSPHTFICKHFDDLNVRELQAIHALRQQVFVVEQNCPYQDADASDAVCWHLFAHGSEGRLLAVCRLIPAGHKYPEAAIGRVATALAVRSA